MSILFVHSCQCDVYFFTGLDVQQKWIVSYDSVTNKILGYAHIHLLNQQINNKIKTLILLVSF